MNYNKNRRIVLDESASLGRRYSSLVECIQNFANLANCTFSSACDSLHKKTGFTYGGSGDKEVLIKTMEVLHESRTKLLAKLDQFSEKRAREKLSGKRRPSKNDIDKLRTIE